MGFHSLPRSKRADLSIGPLSSSLQDGRGRLELIIGRKTFETVCGFADRSYGGKRVVVPGARHVHLDGGETIQGFLRHGLETG